MNLKQILSYIYWNANLAALFNTYDGYVNGNGYKFYLGQKVIHNNQIWHVYHRWCDPLGLAVYCIQRDNNGYYNSKWDLLDKDLIPLTKASKVLYASR